MQQSTWRRLLSCFSAGSSAHPPVHAGPAKTIAVSTVGPRAPVVRQQPEPVPQQPVPIPLSTAEASGIGRAAATLVVFDTTAADAITVSITAAAAATASIITAADAATASITAADAVTVSINDTVNQVPKPSPVTILGAAAFETAVVPLIKPPAAHEQRIVMASVLPVVVDNGSRDHPRVDEGSSLADQGVKGPPHSADSSAMCRHVSVRTPPSALMMAAVTPLSPSTVEGSDDKLLGEKAEALVTMTRSMHDPVGVT